MILGVPYDAEVEYLESTSNLRVMINTGYYQNPDTEYEAVLMQTVSTSTINIGNMDTTASIYGWRLSLHTRIYQDWGNNRLSLDYGSIPGTKFLVRVRNGFLYAKDLDGDFEATATGRPALSTSTSPMYIFRSPNNTTSSNMRLYRLQISEQSKLIMSLIPVRFTNGQGQTEGAMYDRVTKRLFRNQGTGSFIIGPDVAKPVMGLHFMKPRYTAKDYVQDGLVAMWDGEWNAGNGLHDDNAATWKDLVGDNDLVLDASSPGVPPSFLSYPPRLTWGRNCLSTNRVGATVTGSKVQNLKFFEMVFMMPPTDIDFKYGCCWAANGFVRSQSMCLWSYTKGSLTIYNYNKPSYPDNTVKQGIPMSVSFACEEGSTDWHLYRDGASIAPKQGSDGWGTNLSDSKFYLLCHPAGSYYFSNDGVWITGYTARCYDRVLTPEEVAANYEIDKARFNLPDAT